MEDGMMVEAINGLVWITIAGMRIGLQVEQAEGLMDALGAAVQALRGPIEPAVAPV